MPRTAAADCWSLAPEAARRGRRCVAAALLLAAAWLASAAPVSAQPVKGEAKVWQAETLDVSRAALEAFVKAAAGGPAYPIPFDQVIEGVAATEAIVRSAASGKVEKVQ